MMPKMVIRDPTPSWLKPESASVTDSKMTKALRALGHLIGADDPVSQIMGLVTTNIPTKGVMRAFKGGYPYDESGKVIDKFRSPGVRMKGVFDDYVGKNGGFAGFFSDSPDVASRFAGPEGAVFPVEIDTFANPLVIDARGSFSANVQYADMARLPHEKQSLLEIWDVLRGANKGGHDGIIIKNTRDEGTVMVPLDPNKVRSVFSR
jgi:hypothetical protein